MLSQEELSDFQKQIRQDFYRYRNGIVADALKSLYPSGKLIFGLTAPQFMDISKKYPKDEMLGMALWNDNHSRESRLMALYILPPEKIDKEKAKTLVEQVESTEQAEFLAFRILRRLENTKDIFQELSLEEFSNSMSTYCMQMYQKNITSL